MNEDLTWTNVSAAIWNMVESEIGFVEANMLSMGPLFVKLHSQVLKPLYLYVKQNAARSGTRIILYGSSTINGSGFIDDDATGERSQIMTASRSHENCPTRESFSMYTIIVRTNLEQILGRRDSLKMGEWGRWRNETFLFSAEKLGKEAAADAM